jgi:hypothetical protein
MNRREFLKLSGILCATTGFGYAVKQTGIEKLLPEVSASNIHPQSTVPSIYVPLSNESLNIPMDGQWHDVWTDSTKIDLVNALGGTYLYSGKTGYAYAGLKCDQSYIYCYVEYLPPPDDSGKRAFNPNELLVLLDTKDEGWQIPHSDDYLFDVKPSEVSGSYHPLYYQTGLDDQTKGWSTPPGNLVTDESFAGSAFSIISTPTIPQPHPYYEFLASRSRLEMSNPFRLCLAVIDNHVVSNAGGVTQFWASFPSNDFATSDNIFWWPAGWANVHLQQQTPITSTTSSQLVPSKPFDSTELIELGGAAAVGLGLIGLFSRRRSKNKDGKSRYERQMSKTAQ